MLPAFSRTARSALQAPLSRHLAAFSSDTHFWQIANDRDPSKEPTLKVSAHFSYPINAKNASPRINFTVQGYTTEPLDKFPELSDNVARIITKVQETIIPYLPMSDHQMTELFLQELSGNLFTQPTGFTPNERRLCVTVRVGKH